MKTSHLLLAVSGLALLSWGIYSVFFVGNRDSTQAEVIAPTDPQQRSIASDWHKAPGIIALKQDIDSLKNDVAKLQQRLSDLDQIPDITRVQKNLDELTHTVAQLSANSQSLPLSDAEITDAEIDNELRTPEEILAFTEEKHRQQMDVIETSFQSENVDRQWSDIAADKIELALANETSAHLPAATECRATLCKVELSHQDREEIEPLILTLPLAVSELLPAMTIDQVEYADGSMYTTVYLARQGYDFPGAY